MLVNFIMSLSSIKSILEEFIDYLEQFTTEKDWDNWASKNIKA